MKHTILLTKHGKTETWSSLTDICEAHKFPYHTLKTYRYPFDYNGFEFQKIPHKTVQIIDPEDESGNDVINHQNK